MRIQAQDSLLFGDPLSVANLRVGWLREGGAGHSLLQFRRAQRVSFWTAVHRATIEWASVITVFHPATVWVSTFFESVTTGMLCHSGMENRKQEFLSSSS